MCSLVCFIYDACVSQELDIVFFEQPTGRSLTIGFISFTLEEHVYRGQDNCVTLIDTQRVA